MEIGAIGDQLRTGDDGYGRLLPIVEASMSRLAA